MESERVEMIFFPERGPRVETAAETEREETVLVIVLQLHEVLSAQHIQRIVVHRAEQLGRHRPALLVGQAHLQLLLASGQGFVAETQELEPDVPRTVDNPHVWRNLVGVAVSLHEQMHVQRSLVGGLGRPFNGDHVLFQMVPLRMHHRVVVRDFTKHPRVLQDGADGEPQRVARLHRIAAVPLREKTVEIMPQGFVACAFPALGTIQMHGFRHLHVIPVRVFHREHNLVVTVLKIINGRNLKEVLRLLGDRQQSASQVDRLPMFHVILLPEGKVRESFLQLGQRHQCGVGGLNRRIEAVGGLQAVDVVPDLPFLRHVGDIGQGERKTGAVTINFHLFGQGDRQQQAAATHPHLGSPGVRLPVDIRHDCLYIINVQWDIPPEREVLLGGERDGERAVRTGLGDTAEDGARVIRRPAT